MVRGSGQSGRIVKKETQWTTSGYQKESGCAGQRNEIAPSGGERGAPPSREVRSRKSSLPLFPQGTRGGLGGPALTLPLHASSQALLIAAVLTAVPLALVHRAVLVVPARVCQVLTDGALEEAFAALAAVNPVVFACKKRGRAVRLHAHPGRLGILSTSSCPPYP